MSDTAPTLPASRDPAILRTALAECVAERDNLIGERDRLQRQLDAAYALLNDCHDELIGYVDVKDGDDGRPEANTPMSLCQAICEMVPE